MSDHNIYKAMLAIQNEIDAIGKNKTNAQQGFKFRGIDDVYNTVHPLLSKYGVFSVPRVTNSKYETYVNAKGNRATSVYLAVEYTFYAEDGSSVVCAVASEGTDYADKATNKAMSFAHKYAILQIFSIPTDDIIDGDADSPRRDGAKTEPLETQAPPILTETEKEQLRGEFTFRDIEGEIKATTKHETLKELAADLQRFKSVLSDEEKSFVRDALKSQGEHITDIMSRS